jgi:hypothetical protein
VGGGCEVEFVEQDMGDCMFVGTVKQHDAIKGVLIEFAGLLNDDGKSKLVEWHGRDWVRPIPPPTPKNFFKKHGLQPGMMCMLWHTDDEKWIPARLISRVEPEPAAGDAKPPPPRYTVLTSDDDDKDEVRTLEPTDEGMAVKEFKATKKRVRPYWDVKSNLKGDILRYFAPGVESVLMPVSEVEKPPPPPPDAGGGKRKHTAQDDRACAVKPKPAEAAAAPPGSAGSSGVSAVAAAGPSGEPLPQLEAVPSSASTASTSLGGGVAHAPPGGMDEMRAALERYRLAEYADRFDEAGYDDLSYLRDNVLPHEAMLAQFSDDTGMTKPGHLNKLKAYVALEANGLPLPPRTTPAAGAPPGEAGWNSG